MPTVLANVAAGGEQSRVYPLTDAWTTSNLHAGQFTAACGVEIYRGAALGQAYDGNAFICEPTGSLVHREILTNSGVTFTSKARMRAVNSWRRPIPGFDPSISKSARTGRCTSSTCIGP